MNSTNSFNTAICRHKKETPNIILFNPPPPPKKKGRKIDLLACYWFKPRQLPTLLFVCTPWCTLLVVVAQSLKLVSGQTFEPTTSNISFVPRSPKRSATILEPFAQLFQHCWGRARALRMVYKDLWVVSFPRCTAGPNIVGSCCIRLHTTANTNATTSNIVGQTMLFAIATIADDTLSPFKSLQKWDLSWRRVLLIRWQSWIWDGWEIGSPECGPSGQRLRSNLQQKELFASNIKPKRLC